MDGYNGRIYNARDKILPRAVLVASLGFMAIFIGNENSAYRNNTNGVNFKPNIEAILNEEIKLYKNNFAKNLPIGKYKFSGSNGINSSDSYNGKRNM